MTFRKDIAFLVARKDIAFLVTLSYTAKQQKEYFHAVTFQNAHERVIYKMHWKTLDYLKHILWILTATNK